MRHDRFSTQVLYCTTVLVYRAKYDISGSVHMYTYTEHRSRKIFLLAPSGYRFSLLIDINPTRIKKARVSGREDRS